MDDLQRLREMAGIREDSYDHERNIESLNDLSRQYQFEIDDEGRIDVYAQFEGEGMRRFAKFDDFDHMLSQFGKL